MPLCIRIYSGIDRMLHLGACVQMDAHYQHAIARKDRVLKTRFGSPSVMACKVATQRPRVVIIGAGFGGLSAAKSLAKAPFDVVLIDRNNYHMFQPLLYQVATAALSPFNIAWPIRTMFRRETNVSVVLANVSAIDAERSDCRWPSDPVRLPDRRNRRAASLFRTQRLGAACPPA